jgi:hypothetical protein
MLRILVLMLLLANVAFWGWREGLGGDASGRSAPSEHQRLAQQVEPERLRLLNPPGSPATPQAMTVEHDDTETPPSVTPEEDAAPPSAGPAAAVAPPRRCWQLAALPPTQAEALRRTAEAIPGLRGRHTEQAATLPERWIVYLGKFPTAEALQRRRAELRQAGVEYRDVNVPALAPGLALGTYSSEEAARKGLLDVQRQGVRDARVVQERPATRVLTLRWPDLTEAEREQLQDALGTAGRSLAACR